MAKSHYWNENRTIFNIALSGIFLALVLIFQFLSSQFFRVFGFLNINFTVVFIIVLYLATNYKYALAILVLRFLISPAVGSGYTIIGILGHFILLISDLSYIIIFVVFHVIFIKYSKVNIYLNIAISFSIATILNALWMSILNGLIFTPLYLSLLPGGTLPANFIYYVENPSKFNVFGINSYWGKIFALYLAFNLINFTLVSFITSTVTIALLKAKIIQEKVVKNPLKLKHLVVLKTSKESV